MNTLSLRIPKSLHEQIRQLAKREGISINQFIASAAAEKMSALLTKNTLKYNYQTLINLYLRDCAVNQRKLNMKWHTENAEHSTSH